MLNEILTDCRAWTSETIDISSEWSYALSEGCLSVIDAQSLKENSKPISEVVVSDAVRDTCNVCLQPVRAALRAGRGFAIVERIPMERYTLDEAQIAYWIVGQCLGIPIEQNIEGTVLYDVRDTGRDVKEGARFSVTNAESSFHTDGAFGTPVPNRVGLLCIHTARSGGRSQLISAYALHNALLKDYPEVLETLYEPFCFDRRGQFLPGEDPIKRTPIFTWDEQVLYLRYLNYYIQVGHQEAGVPLTSAQEQALEAVESVLRRSDMCVEFDLQPGQMLFTNNKWILHNRTAFEDYSELERRRHYVRLWLQEGAM
jgi:hypothetical protein